MSYPHYSSHVGSKLNKFDGILYYLKGFKEMIEKQKKTNELRAKRIDEQKRLLALELNRETKNIEEITFLNNCITENISICVAHKTFLDENMTLLLLDLCSVFLFDVSEKTT